MDARAAMNISLIRLTSTLTCSSVISWADVCLAHISDAVFIQEVRQRRRETREGSYPVEEDAYDECQVAW
jgi:hypothetical protein